MSDFLERLRERKLVQWALAYAAAAFALLQGIDIVAGKFGWPESFERTLIIALCVGFFVTLLLAWYHGERGAQKVTGTELLLLALLLAIGGGLLWRFSSSASVPAASTTAPAPAATASVNAVTADRRSVAVLPFVNMSGDKDNEYFSDGISEEILNVLARTPDLHVAARTSSFSFKGKSMEAPEIAHALNVRMLLEGSVRKQGERVRITAQLIDASNGYHAWSQTYDRELKDIFAIQDEIATSIGRALEVQLAGVAQAGANSTGTTNLKAYDLYLRGRALWQTRGQDEMWMAVDLLGQAIAADPEFAQAYAALARVYSSAENYGSRMPVAETRMRATDLAEQALLQNPSVPEIYVALGAVAINEYRYASALKLFDRAIALQPSDADAYMSRGNTMRVACDLEGALQSLDRAAALDPNAPIIAANRMATLMALGRQDAALPCEQVLSQHPKNVLCLNGVAIDYLLSPDPARAQDPLERLAAVVNLGAKDQGRDLVAAVTGHGDRHALALRYVAFGIDSSYSPDGGNALWAQWIPIVLMRLGEPGLALDYIERLAASPLGADVSIMMPALDPIRCDLRFVAVVKSMHAADPQHDRVCATKT